MIDFPIPRSLRGYEDAKWKFFVHQFQSKSCASAQFTEYSVLYQDKTFDGIDIRPDLLYSLVFKLSFLYFNNSGHSKLPAPLMYAKKLRKLLTDEKGEVFIVD